jgi:hypothetical protein
MSVGRDTGYKTVNETLSQIMITRGMTPQSSGQVHWNISSDMKNTVLSQALLDGPYKRNALVPASPWLDDKASARPTVSKEIKDTVINISWTPAGNVPAFRWVVYYQYGNKWSYTILNRNDHILTLPLLSADKVRARLQTVSVSAVGRTGNESERAVLTGL